MVFRNVLCQVSIPAMVRERSSCARALFVPTKTVNVFFWYDPFDNRHVTSIFSYFSSFFELTEIPDYLHLHLEPYPESGLGFPAAASHVFEYELYWWALKEHDMICKNSEDGDDGDDTIHTFNSHITKQL